MKRMQCKRGLKRIFCFGAQSYTKFGTELLNVFFFCDFCVYIQNNKRPVRFPKPDRSNPTKTNHFLANHYLLITHHYLTHQLALISKHQLSVESV
jgi:hypothetical protein